MISKAVGLQTDVLTEEKNAASRRKHIFLERGILHGVSERNKMQDNGSGWEKSAATVWKRKNEETGMGKDNIPLIRVEDMKKYYPVKGGIITHTTGYVKAVDGVSFSVMKGQTLGLVGESGCGKSTIGRQLVGLERPTDGKIYYHGRDLEELQKNKKEMRAVRTKLQMIFQDPYSSLNPRKHIFEILAQPMLYHHISEKESVEEDMVKILDMVGLPKAVLGRYPHEFSGGQRQRIGIAKALSLNPEFIVCDEPVSALDVSIQAQILNLLKELQKELGLTLLFVGHGLGAVNYVSDKIAVMYLGKIVEYGDAKEIFRSPVHPYTKALLEAVPIPDPQERGRERNLLQGEIGSSTNPPDGCRFHPRCPYAVEQCRYQPPRLQKIGSDLGKGQMTLPDHEKVQAAELDIGKERKKDVTVETKQAAEEIQKAQEKAHWAACPIVLEDRRYHAANLE